MNNPAAFRACFSDFKLVKTRGIVQLIFEVPVEQADEAYRVVGGMPVAARERWFAIARLAPDAMDKPKTKLTDKDKQSWDTMPASQQAGVLCGEPGFQLYLRERMGELFGELEGADYAARVVRHLCGVTSRSEFNSNQPALGRWNVLVAEYRLWQKYPEFAG